MRLIVLSPHPDDAVLSVGAALVQRVAAGHEVVVVSVCTLTQDPTRPDEDRAALGSLGVTALHLHLLDAPVRGVARTWAGLCGGFDDVAFTDLVTQRFTALKSSELLHPRAGVEIWAPLGCGAHIDHRAVSDAAVAVFANLSLYEERPYARRRGAVAAAWRRRGAEILVEGDDHDNVDDDLFFDRLMGAPPPLLASTTTPLSVRLPNQQSWRRCALPVDDAARHARQRAIALYASQAPLLFCRPPGWPFDDVTEGLWQP